jgi:hypothetical protein
MNPCVLTCPMERTANNYCAQPLLALLANARRKSHVEVMLRACNVRCNIGQQLVEQSNLVGEPLCVARAVGKVDIVENC